jgi:hypothetical protein
MPLGLKTGAAGLPAMRRQQNGRGTGSLPEGIMDICSPLSRGATARDALHEAAAEYAANHA